MLMKHTEDNLPDFQLYFAWLLSKICKCSMIVCRAFITSLFSGEAIRVFKIVKKDDGSSSTVQAGFDFSNVSVDALASTTLSFQLQLLQLCAGFSQYARE
jgi:hypothetical protein